MTGGQELHSTGGPIRGVEFGMSGWVGSRAGMVITCYDLLGTYNVVIRW